jgi:hypothetical protein
MPPVDPKFESFFRGATSDITILGTNPLIPHLEQGIEFFKDILTVNENLRLTLLVESDNENFAQSLCLDRATVSRRASYATLSVHRNRVLGRSRNDGFLQDLADALRGLPQGPHVLSRVRIQQVNLRLPVNLIVADSVVWCAVTATSLPTLDAYFEVPEGWPLRNELLQLVHEYCSPGGLGKYLSVPGDELIQMYDRQGYPRGIFPRSAFYTTAFERYSIWGFVFNRRGELLLHQRSSQTKDGRELWDKSVGGHVDLRDSSTYITAQRELVEEMFLPEAEYSKYIQADLGDIIHFGDWNPKKRPERTFREALASLGKTDWVMFRATGEDGSPLTVTRISNRRLHDDEGQVSTKRTVFRSDVFLFVAPPELLDGHEAMKKLLGVAEESGAAKDHRLVSIATLRDWIQGCEDDGSAIETFTDDLLHANLTFRDQLESFAEFVAFLG